MKNTFFFVVVIGFYLSVIFSSPGTMLASGNEDVQDKLRIPDSNNVQILNLVDGSSLIGRITEIRGSEIDFKTKLGVLTIPIANIKKIKEVPASSIKEGKYWFPNPNSTRLYFATTGRTLKKGEGYFSDYYLFFPGFAYGVTDNITIGGGMSLIPGVGLYDQMFFFTPKIGLKAAENVSFAAGALLVNVPDVFDDDGSLFVGIVYGVGTFGTSDKSFTVGLGYGFVEGDFAEKPMVMLGGEIRFARRMSFVTENWIFPGLDQPLISYGIRFFGEKLSVDLALLNFLGDWAIFPGVPYIDFVFNF